MYRKIYFTGLFLSGPIFFHLKLRILYRNLYTYSGHRIWSLMSHRLFFQRVSTHWNYIILVYIFHWVFFILSKFTCRTYESSFLLSLPTSVFYCLCGSRVWLISHSFDITCPFKYVFFRSINFLLKKRINYLNLGFCTFKCYNDSHFSCRFLVKCYLYLKSIHKSFFYTFHCL